MHGRLEAKIRHDERHLYINDLPPIRYMSEPDPSNLDWAEFGKLFVMECTGLFSSAEAASIHIKQGAGRVLISAPSAGADRTIVYGINHKTITGSDQIISAASCTTNCLAPMAKVVNDACGLKQGFMTTIHAYTGDQRLLVTEHRDPYRARAAASNLIPTTTGAARAVGLVLPELEGRLEAKIRHDERHLYINDLPPIRYMSEPDPSNLDWAEFGKLFVMECTGLFLSLIHI